MARVAHNRNALSVRDMAQNQALAKSIHDAAWTQFAALLAYKAAWPGRRWVAVDPLVRESGLLRLAQPRTDAR